jgi:hypothetical protein
VFVLTLREPLLTKMQSTLRKKKGFYVIIQSGVAVEIVPTPKTFQAKEW